MKSTTKSNRQRLFIDTSAWLAFLLTGEAHHQAVSRLITKHLNKSDRLVTSDYVLDETYTRLITRQSLYTALQLKNKTELAVRSHSLLILFTDETIFHKAWDVFKKYADHKLSFTDATIAVYYQDLKLDTIVTLDQGFAKIGLKTAPKL